MHCHFYQYWQHKNASDDERADDLSKVDVDFENVNRSMVSEDKIDSWCRDPSLSLARRRYKSLAKEVRVLMKEWHGAAEPIEAAKLVRLLAVVRSRVLIDWLSDPKNTQSIG